MQPKRRKQFTFYASYFDTVMSLPKRRQWPTMLALIRYALEGAEPEAGSLYNLTAFTGLRPNIDSSRAKAEAKLREKQPGQGDGFGDEDADQTDAAENKAEKKNEDKSESEKEREKEEKKEQKKKDAPAGASEGTESPDGLSPALPEREQDDRSSLSAKAQSDSPAEEAQTSFPAEAAQISCPAEEWERAGGEPEAADRQDFEQALEPFDAMLRENGELARLWEEYQRTGSDGSGPPSGAEKLVVLSLLSGVQPRYRASNLRARLARSG